MRGHPIRSGHFIPEEAPDDCSRALRDWFAALKPLSRNAGEGGAHRDSDGRVRAWAVQTPSPGLGCASATLSRDAGEGLTDGQGYSRALRNASMRSQAWLAAATS